MTQPLIDLDILKYEIGFSGEYEETDNATGETIHHIRDFDFVQELLDNKIKFICDEVGATEAPILFMTADSFTAKLLDKELIDPIRNSIATVKPYKGTRKGEKPFHFNNIVAYCLANYDCRVAFGLEADDLMALEQINNAKEYGVKMRTPYGDFLLDYEDWLKYSKYTFCKNDSGYFKNDEIGRLHRAIMGNPDLMVDHVNGDRADNRKYNLRICTNKENVRNSKPREGLSQYKGVSLDRKRKKWYATIQVDGVSKGLGRFINEEDAAQAYDDAAKEHFGEYAYLNFSKPYVKPFKETVICSRDKDLKMVPLNHYSWECGKQPSFGPELVDAKGWIKLSADNKTIKGVGLKFFFAQMLIGDTVDNIPGCPKVGPVKAFKLLEECNTKREHELAVIGAYREFYEDEYKERLEEQSKLLWMVRELNDDGSPKHYEWKY